MARHQRRIFQHLLDFYSPVIERRKGIEIQLIEEQGGHLDFTQEHGCVNLQPHCPHRARALSVLHLVRVKPEIAITGVMYTAQVALTYSSVFPFLQAVQTRTKRAPYLGGIAGEQVHR